MSQVTIDGSSRHRISFMKALRNGVRKGDLSKYEADKLRRGYDEC